MPSFFGGMFGGDPEYIVFLRPQFHRLSVTAVFPDKTSEDLTIPEGLEEFLKRWKAKRPNDVFTEILNYHQVIWHRPSDVIRVLLNPVTTGAPETPMVIRTQRPAWSEPSNKF